MRTIARALLIIVYAFDRRRNLNLFVIVSVYFAVYGLVGLLTGDWEVALKVCGWPMSLLLLVCLFGMLARLFFPATFRRAEEELLTARGERGENL